ncbi:S46 family peptidase [Thermodesulfobacteriota bacterium]
MKSIITFVLSLLLICLLSCQPQENNTAVEKPEENSVKPVDNELVYEPGGMWMPQQIATTHAETLKEMGLEIDPQVFADPLEFPLNAIVHLGGCSASFVSPEGLAITNYHCVRGYLQYNSSEGSNLLHTGFKAGNQEEEVSAGPAARIYVTTAVTDVTDRVLEGIAKIEDDLERYKVIEQRKKELTKEFEEANPDSRCDVVSFYGGGEFYVITRLEIKDVRLVYSPHRGIGEFGGDIDNWMWPRHTGDFSFLRAYVAPDGTPAEYSEENVPFKPKAYLKIAQDGFKQGDLAFVVGYPGSTERLTTALETEFDVDWNMPYRVRLYQKLIDSLHEAAGDDETLNIKAASLLAGLENTKKNYIGVLDGAKKKDMVTGKFKDEKKLQEWINSDSERKIKYISVIDEINVLFKEYYQSREKDLLTRLIDGISLLGSGVDIVRMAEERPKPDLERDPDYQERNWQRLEQQQVQKQQSYARELDISILKLLLSESIKFPEEKRPEILPHMFGKGDISEVKIENYLNDLFSKSKLEDVEVRKQLLKNASMEDLLKSDDSIIRLTLKLSPILEEIKERGKRLSGALVLLRPLYFEALNEFKSGNIAPDANNTIRISFGTVRGFKPTPEAEKYYPFTKISEMFEKWEKHHGEHPFDAPDSIIDAVKEERYDGYVPEDIGQVPVNLLTDLDITGGNSGSPTLNSKGEFAGIAFDGNIEGVASDLVFLPDLTRAIHVDVRYILWILDKVENSDYLLDEMGIDAKK